MESTNPLHFPITVGSCLAACALSGWWWLGHDVSRLVMAPSAIGTEPWRLLTSTLLHVNFIHLAFNALWMVRFGMLLEGRLGGLRFAALFVVIAAGAGAGEQALMGSGVGLSGVVYGLFGFLWAARISGQAYAQSAADSRTTAMFIGWFFFCIAATYTKVLLIANVAHGMGGLLGFLVGLAASKPRARIPASLGVAVLLAACGLGAGPYRKYVNLSDHEIKSSWGPEAEAALDAGKPAEAVALYRKALEETPDDWRLWHNLSVAYDRIEEFDEAVAAVKKAHEVEPTEQTRRAVGTALGRLAAHHQRNKRCDLAIPVMREAIEWVSDEPSFTANLELCIKILEAQNAAPPSPPQPSDSP